MSELDNAVESVLPLALEDAFDAYESSGSTSFSISDEKRMQYAATFNLNPNQVAALCEQAESTALDSFLGFKAELVRQGVQ